MIYDLGSGDRGYLYISFVLCIEGEDTLQIGTWWGGVSGCGDGLVLNISTPSLSRAFCAFCFVFLYFGCLSFSEEMRNMRGLFEDFSPRESLRNGWTCFGCRAATRKIHPPLDTPICIPVSWFSLTSHFLTLLHQIQLLAPQTTEMTQHLQQARALHLFTTTHQIPTPQS
jgi:hypothetical protein